MAISVGIIDRFFKKAEKKEPQKSISMSLSKVEKWARDASSDIKEDLVAELQSEADEILQHTEEAREVVEEIRDYKPPQEIKKRMFKPVKTAKPKYVKGMLDGLGSIRPMTGESYEALLDFNKRTQKALKIIHRTQLNQGRIIATFFQEEMPRLGTALNRIIDLQKSIEEGIEDAEKEGERTAGIKAKVLELRSAREREKLLKKEAKEKRAEIGELEEKRAECEKDLERIRGSPEYKKLQHKEDEIASTRERLEALESRGRSLLGPLIRVLRKYAREAKDKDTKRITESYIKNPQKALFEEAEGASKITKILNEVLGMVERGELTIDKKRREKVENAVVNLGSIKEEHTATEKEIKQLKNELASSEMKKEEARVTARLKEAHDGIEKLKSDAESSKANAKDLKGEIKQLKKQLEEALKEEMETEVAIEI